MAIRISQRVLLHGVLSICLENLVAKTLIVLLHHDGSTKLHENLPTSSKTVGQGKDGLIGCIKYYHYKKYLVLNYWSNLIGIGIGIS